MVSQLGGKALSFNNLLDLDSARLLLSEFQIPACVIVKHNNPCGVAVASTALEAYNQALTGRTARDFLYGDLLLAKGRVLEQTGDRAGAIEAYKRFVHDLPSSARADEVRARLALLGVSA